MCLGQHARARTHTEQMTEFSVCRRPAVGKIVSIIDSLHPDGRRDAAAQSQPSAGLLWSHCGGRSVAWKGLISCEGFKPTRGTLFNFIVLVVVVVVYNIIQYNNLMRIHRRLLLTSQFEADARTAASLTHLDGNWIVLHSSAPKRTQVRAASRR